VRACKLVRVFSSFLKNLEFVRIVPDIREYKVNTLYTRHPHPGTLGMKKPAFGGKYAPGVGVPLRRWIEPRSGVYLTQWPPPRSPASARTVDAQPDQTSPGIRQTAGGSLPPGYRIASPAVLPTRPNQCTQCTTRPNANDNVPDQTRRDQTRRSDRLA